jgi:hypothetical protein
MRLHCVFLARDPIGPILHAKFFRQQRLGSCPTQESTARRYRSAFEGVALSSGASTSIAPEEISKAPGNTGRQTLELK